MSSNSIRFEFCGFKLFFLHLSNVSVRSVCVFFSSLHSFIQKLNTLECFTFVHVTRSSKVSFICLATIFIPISIGRCRFFSRLIDSCYFWTQKTLFKMHAISEYGRYDDSTYWRENIKNLNRIFSLFFFSFSFLLFVSQCQKRFKNDELHNYIAISLKCNIYLLASYR